MQFLMLVCTDPEPEQDTTDIPDIETWRADVETRGLIVMGDRLRPAAESRTLRIRGGVRRVTDGPFSESAEWIAGFDVLDCADMEEALEIAAAHPMAHLGRLDLRPLWPLDDD